MKCRDLRISVWAILASFGVLLLGSVSHKASAADAPRTIAELDSTEPYEAMAFNGGVLWVGSSRQMMSTAYQLKVFGADGGLLAQQIFPHSLSFISPYNDRSVIVVGQKSDPNLTHYSVVTYNGPGRALTVKTTVVPVDAWAYQWIGTLGSKEYFIDMSGLTDDPERDSHPGMASRTIFSMTSGRASYMASRVRMPVRGLKVGQDFFVVSRNGIGDGRSEIAHIRSRDFSVTPVFNAARSYITDLAFVPEVNLLAVTEMGADQILLVDPSSHEVKATFPVAGSPRSIANVGHCVVVGSEATNKVALIDVKGEPALLDSADLSTIGHSFKSIRRLAADKASGQVFARSNFPCNPMVTDCSVSENSVVAVKMNMGQCLE